MPYPISIVKDITIDLTDYQEIINRLTEDLNKVGSELEIIKGDKLKVVRCREFSSRVTSIKDLNRGQIELDTTDKKVKVHFRIYLIEHLIFFLIVLTIGAYGLFDSGLSSVMVKIASILLIANFVFCYLFPLMALNSFIHSFSKGTQNK